MRPQIGGAPVTRPEPDRPVPGTPAPVRRTDPPRQYGSWLIPIVVLGALAAGGWYVWKQRAPARQTASSITTVRTATVSRGNLIRTLRLTGTTGAEKYVALITPQLRGRGDGHRDAKEFPSGQNVNRVVQSNARKTGSGSSSSASSGSSDTGDSSSAPSVQSTMGQSSSMTSSAFQASTSRISRGSGSTSRSTSTQSGSTASSTTGTSGLGSTSGSLFNVAGGGGGGGGFGEFMLVLQKLAKPGSHVRKGEVIAEFDRVNMLNRVDDFRAAVAQTEASFKKLQAELEVGRKAHQQTLVSAKADLDKARLDLKTTPVLSAIEAEKAKLALEEAESRYKQVQEEERLVEVGMKALSRTAEIEVQQSRIDLKRTETNAERMVVRSPMDGLAVVQNTFRGSEFAQIQEGDQLWPGMMFIQVVDPSSMVINATVNQVDVENMRIGQKAKVRFDAYPGLELDAHLYSIGAITKPGGQRASFVKEVPVRLKLDSMDPRVIPDLSVSCDITLAAEQNAILLPKGAAFNEEGATGSYAYVKVGSGWERRRIELGLSDNLAVAVQSGVQPGDVVALEPPPLRSKESTLQSRDRQGAVSSPFAISNSKGPSDV